MVQVNDRFKLDWGTYLTTSEQVIYGLIDGRGSGFKVMDLGRGLFLFKAKPLSIAYWLVVRKVLFQKGSNLF